MIRGDPNDFSVSSPIPTQSASILGGPGGDDGRLLRRREGFPGEMAQAAPEIGARQGFRWRKRAPAAQRGRVGVSGLVRLGTFLAALLAPWCQPWRVGGKSVALATILMIPPSLPAWSDCGLMCAVSS